MQIADYLECTLEQRNTLLLAGGYAPEKYLLEAEGLEKVLAIAVDTIAYLPLPAFVITREWDIHRANGHFHRLFGSWFSEAHEREKNVLQLLFDSRLPARARLQRSPRIWDCLARRAIHRFKLDNVLAQHEPWYLELLDRLMEQPDFERYWSEGPGEERERVLSDHVEILTEQGVPVLVYTLEIHLSTYDYPLICAHIPYGDAARHLFAELGLPTPENGWSVRNMLA
jgi:hypothetical protein